MKRIVSLVLTLCMLLSACAFAAAEESKYPISEGTYPIVPEGEEVTLRIGVVRHSTMGGEPEKLWLWNYLSQLMNVKFEFVTVLDSAVTERKNLMFAADELPDALIGFGLTTAELVTYGQTEHQLLALNDYVNEEYMPNLCQWLEAYPEIRDLMTAPDGNMYSLPRIRTPMNPGDSARLSANYINVEWLEKNGKERPTTVEELTELLREFKKTNPDGIPYAASADILPGLGTLLNAMGFLSDRADYSGRAVTLRNGKPVIPCMEDEFKAYLEVCHTWYEEGLIHPDYFTMDNTAINAAVGEGDALIFPGQPYAANPAYESFSRFSALTPLKSEYNDTPMVPVQSSHQIGGFVVSAGAEHVDVLMKMADWFFSALGGFYQWYGPAEDDTEMQMGMEGVRGWTVDENGVGSFVSVNEGIDSSNAAYILGHLVSNWVAFGNDSHWLGREDEGLISMACIRQYLAGHTPEGFNLDPTLGFSSASLTASQYVLPYIQPTYPSIVYMDEETTLTVSDLRSVLDSYIEQEVAKFITGRRSIEEFDAFRAELKGMGIDELLSYYQEAYEAYQSNANR